MHYQKINNSKIIYTEAQIPRFSYLLSKIIMLLVFQSFAPKLFLALSVFQESDFHKSYMLPYIFKPNKLIFEVKKFNINSPYYCNSVQIRDKLFILLKVLKLVLFVNFAWKLQFKWNLRLNIRFNMQRTHFWHQKLK